MTKEKEKNLLYTVGLIFPKDTNKPTILPRLP